MSRASREAWKAEERWYAKQIGGSRVPVTGRARGDVPDIAHPRFSVEVKRHNQLRGNVVTKALDQAAASNPGGKLDLVLYTVPQGPGHPPLRLAIMPFADWLEISGLA